MIDTYVFDVEDFNSLKHIMTRLYNDKPLTNDQRRDLANAMHAILHRAVEIDSTQI